MWTPAPPFFSWVRRKWSLSAGQTAEGFSLKDETLLCDAWFGSLITNEKKNRRHTSLFICYRDAKDLLHSHPEQDVCRYVWMLHMFFPRVCQGLVDWRGAVEKWAHRWVTPLSWQHGQTASHRFEDYCLSYRHFVPVSQGPPGLPGLPGQNGRLGKRVRIFTATFHQSTASSVICRV